LGNDKFTPLTDTNKEPTVPEIEQLAATAPRLAPSKKWGSGRPTSVDWSGVREAATVGGFDTNAAILATWCSAGERLNPYATETGSQAPSGGKDGVAFVFANGVLATDGKRTRKGVDAIVVPLSRIRSIETDNFLGVGFGHYMIHFVGPGDILLGYLFWTYDTPKVSLFRGSSGDNSAMLAAAEEFERVHKAVKQLIGS
jgi:hypothetical protein